jgi:hypothetical protein
LFAPTNPEPRPETVVEPFETSPALNVSTEEVALLRNGYAKVSKCDGLNVCHVPLKSEDEFVNLLTPEKVFASLSNVEDAAVPAATLIVTGDVPMIVKAEHEALPVHDAVVVPTAACRTFPEPM